MFKEIEGFVRGRVQGVMYRDFARRTGRGLGLKGTVENLPDGRVRVVAQGEEEILRRFIGRLKRGSLFSRVESVEVSWREAGDRFDSFKIIG